MYRDTYAELLKLRLRNGMEVIGSHRTCRNSSIIAERL